MGFRVGLCTNVLYCSFASSRQDVKLPTDARFLCPQCGKPLSDRPTAASSMRAAAIAGGGLALTGGALFVVGAMFGHHSAPAETAPHVVTAAGASEASPAAVAPLAAPTMSAASNRTSAPAGGNAFAAALRPGERASAMRVAMIQPAPSVSQPGVTQSDDRAAHEATAKWETAREAAAVQQAAAMRAQQQADEKRRAQQAKAALDAKAAEDAQEAEQAQATQQAQAAQDARVAQQARAQQEAARQAKARLAEAAQQRVPQEAHVAQARPAPPAPGAPAPVVAKAPAPVMLASVSTPPRPAPRSGPSRGFSALPLSGGATGLPARLRSGRALGRRHRQLQYRDKRLSRGCRVVASRGGPAFGDAVMSWLGSGRVRYAPVLRAGEAVAEIHQWNVNFQP
ncbi:MAG: hypothetical protein WDN04_22935 [Rhodospirillales bacterium]